MRWLVLFILALLLSSCFLYRKDTLKDGITVSIVLSASDGFSFAGDNDNPGNVDAYIDGNLVSMFVFDENGKYMDRAVINRVVMRDYNQCVVTALLKYISADDCVGKFRVVIVANSNSRLCSMRPPVYFPLKIGTLYSEMVFDYLAVDGAVNEFTKSVMTGDSANGVIPLWGTTTVEFSNGCTFDVSLLRSFALIKVFSADAAMKIDSVKLSGGICKGYVAPLGAENIAYTRGVKAADLNVPVASDKEAYMNTYFYKSGDAFYLYLPEQNAGACSVDVVINGKTYPMFLGDYSTNTPLPILRNTIYSYSVGIRADKTSSLGTYQLHSDLKVVHQ